MRSRTTDAIAAVSSYGWLAACPLHFRSWLIKNVRWESFSAGSAVVHFGSEDVSLYCVGDGQVSFLSAMGATDIGTSYFSVPGFWWGHAPLLGLPRAGSVVADTDTLCGMVPSFALRSYLAANPKDWRSIALGVTGLFVMAAGAHADLLIRESRRRIAATILRLGGRRHQLFRISPPESFVCTQDTLAGAVVLSRNTVGQVTRSLENDGLIMCRYGRIAILDARRLAELVNED